MLEHMELVAIKKMSGKVTQPIDPEFLPPGYGGGGGVSSWNDLTDRPFYEEVGEVAILPETTVEFDPDSGEGAIMDVLPLVVGSTYKVYWNSAEYSCVAGSFDMDGVPLTTLGNLGVMTGEDGTDEPFLLLAFPADIAAQMGAGAMCVALDGSTSATASIKEAIVHQIDEKFIPTGARGFVFAVDMETDFEDGNANDGGKIITKSYDTLFETITKGGSAVVAFTYNLNPTQKYTEFLNVLSAGFVDGGFSIFVLAIGTLRQWIITNGAYHNTTE